MLDVALVFRLRKLVPVCRELAGWRLPKRSRHSGVGAGVNIQVPCRPSLALLAFLVSLLAVTLLRAPRAEAIVELRAAGGAYSGTYKFVADGTGTAMGDDVEKLKTSGTQITADLLFNPIPVVPVGIGGFYSIMSSKGSTDSANGTMTGSRGGIALMAWIPMPKFRPYLRAGYYLFGKEKMELTPKEEVAGQESIKVKYDFKPAGYQATAGVGFKLAPFVQVFVEYTMESTTLTTKQVEATLGGTTVTADLAEDAKVKNSASTLSLGLGFGI